MALGGSKKIKKIKSKTGYPESVPYRLGCQNTGQDESQAKFKRSPENLQNTTGGPISSDICGRR
jgi:hypothetical protein